MYGLFSQVRYWLARSAGLLGTLKTAVEIIISSADCSPQRTSLVGSGLKALFAELSYHAVTNIFVPLACVLAYREIT